MIAKAEKQSSNRNRNLTTAAGALLLLLLVVLFRNRIQFDWPSFLAQLRHVSWGHIVAGIAIIYASYFLRALRWSIFLKAAKRVSALSLVGSQFIGFTAISLFGRFADLSRPYIIGKRMHLSFASQVAVYTIERMFDLGAAAVIFSLSLTATPAGSPNHKVFVRAGVISFAATAGIAIFAAAVYVAGNAVAAFLKNALGRISSTAGQQAGEKVLAFRHGLIAISSVSDLVSAAAVSLLMWATVGEAYVQTMHAFPQAPELATLTYASVMLIMAASMGGSLIQLPIIGWFTQIAITAAALHALFGAPLEAATACGAMLQVVLWIAVIPVGLIWAQVGGVSVNAAAEAKSLA